MDDRDQEKNLDELWFQEGESLSEAHEKARREMEEFLEELEGKKKKKKKPKMVTKPKPSSPTKQREFHAPSATLEKERPPIHKPEPQIEIPKQTPDIKQPPPPPSQTPPVEIQKKQKESASPTVQEQKPAAAPPPIPPRQVDHKSEIKPPPISPVPPKTPEPQQEKVSPVPPPREIPKTTPPPIKIAEKQAPPQQTPPKEVSKPKRPPTIETIPFIESDLDQDKSYWQALANFIESEIQSKGEDKQSIWLYYELGNIWREKLGVLKNAALCYQKSYKLNNTFAPNLKAARHLFRQANKWNMVLNLFKEELKTATDKQYKIHVLYEIGRILYEKLGKQDEGASYWEQILELDPSNYTVIKVLESHYTQKNDTDRLKKILRIGAEALKDPDQKSEMYFKLSQLSKEKEAEEYLNLSLKENPHNIKALHALQEIYRIQQRWEEYVDVLLKEAVAVDDPGEKSELYFTSAKVYEEHLNQPKLALQTLLKAFDVNQDSILILDEIIKHYENQSNWEKLISFYELIAEKVRDKNLLLTYFYKIGTIYEEKLMDTDKAIEAYQKVLNIEPTYLPVLQALGRLYYRKQDWQNLFNMYSAEIIETKNDEQKAIKLYKMAEILENNLKDEKEAIRYYQECLKLNKGYLPALKALGRLYAKHQQWEDLIEMYEQEVLITTDKDQLTFLLEKIGTLWEDRLGNKEKAMEAYSRILAENPRHLPALRALGRYYSEKGEWEKLIKINETEIGIVNDQKLITSLYHKNGEIYEEYLDNKEKAIECYEKVLSLDPTYLPALRALGRLYYQKGLWEKLIDMYEREIEVTTNEDHRLTLIFKLGKLYEEQLLKEDMAIEKYKTILEQKPDHLPAFTSLVQIYSKQKKWDKLIELYEDIVTSNTDEKQKAIYYYKMGQIARDYIEDVEKAAEFFNKSIENDPLFEPSLNALIDIYKKDEKYNELISLLERKLVVVKSEWHRISILENMSDIYIKHLNNLDQAIKINEEILKIDGNNIYSMKTLDQIYEKRGQYDRLIELYSRMAEVTKDPAIKVALENKIISIKEYRFDDLASIQENYENIFNSDPTNISAINSLEFLYLQKKDYLKLYNFYTRLLLEINDEDYKVDLLLKIADIAITKLKDPKTAEERLHELLKIQPNNLVALKYLEWIYSTSSRWEEYIHIMERIIANTSNTMSKIKHLMLAASVYQDKLTNFTKAIEKYRDILKLDPNNKKAYRRLVELMEYQGKTRELKDLLEELVKRVTDTEHKKVVEEKLSTL